MEAVAHEMMDHIVRKPDVINGYSVHRMVAELVAGSPVLFCDNGDHMVIRTDKPITSTPRSLTVPAVGEIIAFQLKACAADRKGGRNIYPPLGDWRQRRSWLEAQGNKHGFEVLAVHVDGRKQIIVANGGRKFSIDASQFTGVLKITDAVSFSSALANGIGRVGKAFGMGMLII